MDQCAGSGGFQILERIDLIEHRYWMAEPSLRYTGQSLRDQNQFQV
jgi:hypothetical protein